MTSLSILLKIVLIYFTYISVISIIEYYEKNRVLTVIITWFSNFLLPFAFGLFYHLDFNMFEILTIINAVVSVLAIFIPLIFLFATMFAILIYFMPHYYEYYLILGVKFYLGGVSLICICFLLKKLFITIFYKEEEKILLFEDDNHTSFDATKKDSSNFPNEKPEQQNQTNTQEGLCIPMVKEKETAGKNRNK